MCRRIGILGGLLSLGLAAPLTASASVEDPSADPAIVVVAAPATPTAGEQVLRAEMQQMGYATSYVDDGAPAVSDPALRLIVIAPSVNTTTLGTKYRDSTTPVLALAAASWSALGLSSGPGGVQYTSNNLLVVDTTHPIAAGLPEVFSPAGISTMQSVEEVNLADGADPVATRTGSDTAHVVYTLSEGALRSGGTPAPANRAAVGLSEQSLTSLTDDGYQLLRNSIGWTDDPPYVDVAHSEAAPTSVARWELNEKTGTTVFDAEPPPQNGTRGTKVKPGGIIDTRNRFYHFPGGEEFADDPARLVQIPDSGTALDPLNALYTFSVRVRRPAGTQGFNQHNVMQKGQSQAPGGFFKLEWNDGINPKCTFRDGASPPNTAMVPFDKFTLKANTWYTVSCIKMTTGIRIKVDTEFNDEPSTVASINNSEPVTLGGKPNCGGGVQCDYFRGDIDRAAITRG